MKTLRDRFILRYWHLPDGTERVAIEHVQSGERATVGTVAAALDWLTGHAGASSNPTPVTPSCGATGPPAPDPPRPGVP